jgi:hypothetical protein
MAARTAWRVAAPGFLLWLAASSEASAAWVGDRFFPSTLATVVPTAADFLNTPYIARLPATAATPSIREVDIPTTFSKLITPNLGVTFTETFRILEQANTPTRTGFDNFVLGAQYHLYVNSQHEFIFTIGGTAAIGGTGESNVATSFSTLTPTVYIGKGFGDLPDSMAWLRPVAITTQVGVALPTRSSNPNTVQWGFALEYSLLTTSHGGRGGSRFAEGWVPLVEFALQTPSDGPSAGKTTGTVNPGVIWVGQYFQFAAEAIVPINGPSGRDVGVRAQAHLYFSAIFPNTIGKPIFSK